MKNWQQKCDQNDCLFLPCFVMFNRAHSFFFMSGSFYRQECSELFVGKTGLRDPHAELGGSHGGPDPPPRDHRQQCESVTVYIVFDQCVCFFRPKYFMWCVYILLFHILCVVIGLHNFWLSQLIIRNWLIFVSSDCKF